MCSPTSRSSSASRWVFISRDLGVVHHVSDDVLVMHNGRVVERGTGEAVFSAPRHPYTQALLSALPAPGSTARSTTMTLFDIRIPSLRPEVLGAPFPGTELLRPADRARRGAALDRQRGGAGR